MGMEAIACFFTPQAGSAHGTLQEGMLQRRLMRWQSPHHMVWQWPAQDLAHRPLELRLANPASGGVIEVKGNRQPVRPLAELRKLLELFAGDLHGPV